MKGKVVEDFGVYPVEVSYCKRTGIKYRAQKANELTKIVVVNIFLFGCFKDV